MVTVKFSNYGSLLSTRALAVDVSKIIEHSIESAGYAVLDFGGVTMVSLSFSDELFGRLIKKFGLDALKSKTHFVNASTSIKTVVSQAISLNRTIPTVHNVVKNDVTNLDCI
jgi:hypothetical protein